MEAKYSNVQRNRALQLGADWHAQVHHFEAGVDFFNAATCLQETYSENNLFSSDEFNG